MEGQRLTNLLHKYACMHRKRGTVGSCKCTVVLTKTPQVLSFERRRTKYCINLVHRVNGEGMGSTNEAFAERAKDCMVSFGWLDGLKQDMAYKFMFFSPSYTSVPSLSSL